MRTLREMGIRSVAVYSDADRAAPFVDYADEAHALGGLTAAESYLVVRVALEAGGTRALPRAILAASPQPTVGTLTPQGFFYLAESGVIRLVKLR